MADDRALREKVQAAEEHVALIRVAVVSIGTAWFLAGGASGAASSRAAGILGLAWLYALTVAITRPYRFWPILTSSWATTITDAIFSTIWIWATGGLESSWFLLYYVGIAATAFRFRSVETFGAAIVYGASYVLLLAVLGDVQGHAVEIGLRVAFIFLLAALCGPLANETVEQSRQKLAMREIASQAERAAAKLRGMLQGAHMPIVMFDPEGRIEFFNAQAESLFELAPAAGIGRGFDAMLASVTEPEAAREVFSRAMTGAVVPEHPMEVRRSRGESRDLLGSFSAYHDVAGRRLGMIAVLYDETARRQRERDMRSLRIKLEEAERRRIARELHDQVGQILTGLALSLDSATRRGPIAPEHLETARALVNDLMARVRALSLDLRPAVLDDLGLMPALMSLVERFGKQSGLQIEFRQTGLERRFSTEIETAAFRVVQEALTNVARHAGVKAATVRAWADDATLSVQVEDAGRGFDPDAVSPGTSSGLAGMRERAALLGGSLTIESAPSGGTRLTAELPLGGRTDAAAGA